MGKNSRGVLVTAEQATEVREVIQKLVFRADAIRRLVADSDMSIALLVEDVLEDAEWLEGWVDAQIHEMRSKPLPDVTTADLAEIGKRVAERLSRDEVPQ